MTNIKHLQSHAGFTLLEVLVGLAIMVMILTGVFAVAGGAIDLSRRSNDLRQEEVRHTQFTRFIRDGLLQLAPRSKIELPIETTLSLSDPGSLFNWPGGTTGSTRCDFRYHSGAIELAHFLGDAEVSSITLMEKVANFRWQLYDPENQVWISKTIPENQGRPTRRPTLAKLHYRLTSDSEDRIEVFQIPRFLPVQFQPPTIVN